MNKVFITLCLALFLTTGLMAQAKGKERIKAYKTAYITEQLDLSSEEAEVFWPVYNKYDKKIFELKVMTMKKERSRVKELGGTDALSEEEASEFLETMLTAENEAIETKVEMYDALSEILNPLQLFKLYQAEMNFNKRLLHEYKRGRTGNKMN
ncbi:hypothetical protein [Lutimonas sp.]|uniref:hypothetical protein n=1 Tax=Lutimonas sp. TaxID=1872403 RepID=UPI003D9BED42